VRIKRNLEKLEKKQEKKRVQSYIGNTRREEKIEENI